MFYVVQPVAPVDYSSGGHRILLLILILLMVLVREFESRRGEILNLFAKKKNQLLRAPSVGKHNSTRASRRGKKELKSSRDKNAGHEP